MAAQSWPRYRPVRLLKTGSPYPVDCDRCGRRVGTTAQYYDDGLPPPPVACLHCVAAPDMEELDAVANAEPVTTIALVRVTELKGCSDDNA